MSEPKNNPKCKAAGCDDRLQAKHRMLYFEHWDVHPPAEFVQWWSRHGEAKACKVVTAWNTDRNRQEFKRWQRGEPEPEETLTPEERERGNKFLADLFARRETKPGLGSA
ncbi:MAG: hypothetical protein H0U23_04350 [Blastocatellia bacterium]|jgi:hypothetical protein|nr:hypothetical protein [Blastocatellia bacterium]